MRAELQSLLDRMNAREQAPGSLPPGSASRSDQTTSWKAHREAEALDDYTLVAELAEYVKGENEKRKRDCAYFVIGKLGLQKSSAECARLLLDGALRETDKHVLSSLLDRLADLEKPEGLDLRMVKVLLEDARGQVRTSAIRSLRRARSPEVEDWLLHRLTRTDDPYDIASIHSTLNSIGTQKSLPALTANLSSRKRDVKLSAKYAIEAIKTRSSDVEARR